MPISTRQGNLFAAEDWRKIYNTFQTADFQSYDYETLRKTMVDYLRTYYPEDFNDYIESSEFVAILDLMSFMGQSLSFRSDLNFRENFIQTAERRDSVYRMANMLGYVPNRNRPASGLLKVISIRTTESIVDSNGINLENRAVRWNDPTNNDWLEQFVLILNKAIQVDERIGRPSGSVQIGAVRHDLYHFRTQENQIPTANFTATIDNKSMEFNIYNGGLNFEDGIYEISPQPSNSLGFYYRTDGEGNNSPNTGFFLGFKQGRLSNFDFTINEKLPNRLVGLNVDNINNTDVWLWEISDAGGYVDEWTKVELLKDNNIIYNNISDQTRKLFSVQSRANDQVDLAFGDGIFSDIPVGIFRATARISNGLTYTITPQEMRNINIEIGYLSKSGNVERINMIMSLQSTVNNASARESLADIKVKAPQNIYTQNRMINGEDYNTLPYTKFGDILKVKSVNRTASGISRFLDVKDVTSKFSSTNIFCEDGFVHKQETTELMPFEWTTSNEIQNFILNTLTQTIRSKETINLYYSKYATKIPPTTYWIRGLADSSICTGFFVLDPNPEDGVYAVQQLGSFSSNNRKFIEPGALLLFRSPSGYYFDIDRTLKSGVPTQDGQVTEIWASIKSVVNDGTAEGLGFLDTTSNTGAVTLTENIPSGAELVEIYPVYIPTFSVALEQTLLNKILNNENFALRWDYDLREWKIINPLDINTSSEFSLSNAGDTSNTSQDASWLILMVNSGSTRYNVYYRQLNYFWGSENETRFYFDPQTRVYDSRNGTVVKDQIRVLKGNTLPDSNENLATELRFEIYDVIKFSDGFRDDTKVKITFADSDNDGVPDDPQVFESLVNETVNPLNKLVYFEKYLDYDNIERYRYFDNARVTTNYSNLSSIELVGKYAHPVGTVFYAYAEDNFYMLTLVEGVRTIELSTNYIVRVGRNNLKFQYKHNSPNDRRIDPSPSNIIDMFILTTSYDRAYRLWLADNTDTLTEPEKPTVLDMELSFKELRNLKSVSDEIIFSPAQFKPLFGNKANFELQAIFKIVRSESTRLSNSELKSKVITAINEYFSIENWDFGDTFYYSELAAYIHQELAPDLATIVIVPKSSQATFGELFQITCEPNEIFVNAASVDDVEVIDSITAARLQSVNTNSIFGGYTPNSIQSI